MTKSSPAKKKWEQSFYEKYRETILANQKRYRENNKAKLKQYYRDYYQKNQAKIKAQKIAREYKMLSPENISNHFRRMKKREKWELKIKNWYIENNLY